MRILSIAVLFAMICAQAGAQTPRVISFQGVLADAGGTLVPDGNHTLRLRLFDAPTGGTEVFAETQDVPVAGGVFNVLIGSAGDGIPIGVTFDRPYFLGVAINGGAELVPRSPLTPAPYSLRAVVADALAANAPDVVRSVNGGIGAIVLEGSGGTTINRIGSTVTISSTAVGATGIQGVQNSDGSLVVANPNGPIASISVADSGITATKLAPGVVPLTLPPSGAAAGDLSGTYPNPAVAKIQGRGVSATTPSSSQILKFNGSVWAPGADDAGPWTISGTNISSANSGNVGIGTASPATKLEVNGTTRTRDLQITAGASSGRMIVSNASGTAVWSTDMKIVGGNVGIGDTTPKGRLHVAAGSSGFDPSFTRTMVIEDDGNLTLSLRGPANLEQSILFERAVGDTGTRISSQPDGDMRIGRYRFTDNGSASTSFQLFLDVQSGNFGIGRDPVANDLEVDGQASKTTAGNWLANSDRRIKTDVNDIDESFATMLRLHPVRFRYTDEWRQRNPAIENRFYYNFIAQEYGEVFPHAVRHSREYIDGDENDLLQIDTYDAQVVAIKAVQQLILENKALRESLDELRKRIERIESVSSQRTPIN